MLRCINFSKSVGSSTPQKRKRSDSGSSNHSDPESKVVSCTTKNTKKNCFDSPRFKIRSRPGHPLQNHIVLGIIFQYLPLEDLKSCRLVCQVWKGQVKSIFHKKSTLEIDMLSEHSGRTASDFLSVMKSEFSLFPTNNLCVMGVDMRNWEMNRILDIFGTHLSSLVLDAVAFTSDPDLKISRKHIVKLANSCPNLQSLELRDFPDHVIEKGFPKLMKAVMTNSLPSLKRFAFHANGYFCPLDAQFIMDIMDFAPNIKELSFSIGDDDALDEVLTALELRDAFMEKVQVLKFGTEFGNTLFETHVQTLVDLKLNLTTLDIGCIGKDINSFTFRLLLEKLSPTLEILKLGALTKTEQNRKQTVRIRFPRLMQKLVHLEVRDISTITVGSIKFIKRLPKLKTCLLNRVDYIGSVFFNGCPIDSKFWKDFFLNVGQYGLCHTELVELSLPRGLCEMDVIFCIKEYFPCLKRLSVDLTSNVMLSGVIQILNDTEIEDLSLKLCEVGDTFDSAVTGIPISDCKMMLKNKTYWPVKAENDMKIWSSFADWKCLRKLSIISKSVDYHNLNGVVLCHGFSFAKSLTSLELGNFSINDVFLLELIKSMSLFSLKLISCNVAPGIWGSSIGIQDRIKLFFPSMNFQCDPPVSLKNDENVVIKLDTTDISDFSDED